jgi:hypothetical protein
MMGRPTILQELEIEKGTTSSVETTQDFVPAALALVTFDIISTENVVPMSCRTTNNVRIGHATNQSALTPNFADIDQTNGVLQWEVLLRQFLQSDNDMVTRGIDP